ncbi:MAG: OmpA family protein [Rhodospirillales bacterium]|nr:OmpA family protein [Rhodospirillales bacterium]
MKRAFGRRLAGLGLMTVLTLGAACAAPADAAAQQSVPTQSVVVFFKEWSAALDAHAKQAIARAASWAKAHPHVTIQVTGYADPTGGRRANILMSELRAQVVADQLVADGVAGDRLRQNGEGAVKFAVSSLESRRVEISAAR